MSQNTTPQLQKLYTLAKPMNDDTIFLHYFRPLQYRHAVLVTVFILPSRVLLQPCGICIFSSDHSRGYPPPRSNSSGQAIDYILPLSALVQLKAHRRQSIATASATEWLLVHHATPRWNDKHPCLEACKLLVSIGNKRISERHTARLPAVLMI